MNQCARRVAVLTGAAGGIGAETASVFAEQGYDLALLDCANESLLSLRHSLSDKCDIQSYSGDLADLTWCENTVSAIASHFGHIDALINLAAWREIVTMNTISAQSWQRTLDVCLTSPAFLARWCAAHMSSGGAIINVSSLNARQSTGMAPAYVAAKGGLEALTHELAALYGPRGIRVAGIALGAIDTALSHDLAAGADSDAQKVGDGVRHCAEGMIPLRRYGTAQEAASAIAWLASSSAAYLTGTTIEYDGGWGHHHLPHEWKSKLMPSEFE